ncbi:hypothetical protein J4E85_008450 [Alternaria conjuncta]|uniref:uncharacterized protein n=1 Tax=Alternaria conjuncta TaxID=181017 RepID=UPI00221EB412|nr:uncharacterized protein J4E85_008450 [Alternaria conjuncta]KAI4923412.1 hypothetical protein J4E85_008450 [Alternaria conjuncta]
MQARLPRELRDLIYDYIWDEDFLGLTSGYMSPAAGSSTYLWLKPHLRPRGGHSTKPIVINPGYVDLDTAREALEAYYRVSAYRKDAFLVRSPERIRSLLHDDVFNLGVLPTEHLRAMDLHLTQEQFQWDTPAKINEAMLSEAFAQLTKGIRRKKDFKLRIMITQTEIRLKQWDLLFGILVPFCHAFQAEGAQVSVSWGYTRSNWYSETIRCVYSLDEIIRVWTPYLDWEEKVIEFLDGQSEITDSRRKYRNEDEEEEEEEEEDVSYPHESNSDESDPDESDSDESDSDDSDRMSLVDDK